MPIFSNKRKETKSLTVNDIIGEKNSQLSTVTKAATVQECAKVMTFMQVGVLIVLDDERKFAGMVSERSIVEALGRDHEDLSDKTAEDLLSTEVTACTAETSLSDVLDTMRDQGVRHVPVLGDGSNIQGIISISDILRHYI